MDPEIAAEAVDAAFEELGVAASYSAGGTGPSVPVTLIRHSPDAIARFGDAQPVVGTTIIDVRASEVAGPVKGDTFTVGGEVLVVLAKPIRRDAAKLVWSCEAGPA